MSEIRPARPRTWVPIFLELALRAISQVHSRYNVWGITQGPLNVDDFKRLNQGDGAIRAPETAVCDAISQQIVDTGLWKAHQIEGEERSYTIEREFAVRTPKGTKRVDLVYARIQDRNLLDDTLTQPVLIEAKRFEVIKTQLLEKGQTSNRQSQLTGIDDDIEKLIALIEHAKESPMKFRGTDYKNVFGALLLWGEGSDFNIDTDLINNLRNMKYVERDWCEVRRMPSKWSNCDKLADPIKVESYFWVALIHIAPPEKHRTRSEGPFLEITK